MSYKVTVIIPSYNSVEFLDSTIDSIKVQTIGFENIELIIIDDYSTDSTQELINKYNKIIDDKLKDKEQDLMSI